ncbi:uncharacterized protein K489DRAFT_213846 [Dissoconium aciculare CBS 342.82]|uniref:Uncharacterized protein n=1 Tax=Dissoconium aciculare CBS 342.82 TaxID=1314786 RepID=A0A6J3M582_9PEZI|nr:uncharacterized protein K489DRAFT_213846 [Dissoconium aciculare CBS 342.82]KAF1822674.1 hypothetical protein K489DRAFT_213846 [Dissoconium aciculare CBS 342.82]
MRSHPPATSRKPRRVSREPPPSRASPGGELAGPPCQTGRDVRADVRAPAAEMRDGLQRCHHSDLSRWRAVDDAPTPEQACRAITMTVFAGVAPSHHSFQVVGGRKKSLSSITRSHAHAHPPQTHTHTRTCSHSLTRLFSLTPHTSHLTHSLAPTHSFAHISLTLPQESHSRALALVCLRACHGYTPLF